MKKDDFDAWARSQGKREKNRAWMSWPDKATAEIRRVLELNDAGEASVSCRAMVERLREVHGIASATMNTVADYVRHLGRQGWSKK